MRKPLEGIRVVELGTHVVVPKTARVMADWGAEVIKVEPPHGEPWRAMGRVWNMPHAEDNNPIFQTPNANKKSLCLNLKLPEGRAVLMKLLERTDIFLTNTRPKPLAKLGVDYDSLKEKFPKIIYGHFSGFGQKGPDKDRAGFDVAAFWARGGMPVEWCVDGETPIRPQPGTGDAFVSSIFLAGVLAALYRREKTGEGELLETSLFGASLWYNSLGMVMGQPRYGLKYPRAREENPSPLSPLYRTRDKDWLMIALPEWEQKIGGILKMLGIEEYVDDPRFATLESARKDIKALIPIFDEAFAQISTKKALQCLSDMDIVHEKMANPKDLHTDEQAWANGYLHTLELENGDEVVVPRNPIQFKSQDPPKIKNAPLLGADSAEILGEIGYSKDEITRMAGEKIIRTRQ